jgi:diguanylate cyclase (GGDEF)-like protein
VLVPAAVAGAGGAIAGAVLLASQLGAGAIALAALSLPLLCVAVLQHCALIGRAPGLTYDRRAEARKGALGLLARRALECADVLTLIGEAMDLVQETLGTASCVTQRRLASGEIRNVATAGDVVEVSIPAAQSSQSAYTLGEAEPVISNDLAREKRFSASAGVVQAGMSRGISARIRQRAGANHAIVAYRRGDDPPFTLEEARLLRGIAYIIGGALDREANEQELMRRALEDPLTGLANRALLLNHLEAELRHGRRLGDSVSVLALDLDRFKVFIDTVGHPAGDTLLRKVAARLTACVREEDLVARNGGDEFAIVCSRTTTDHAVAEVAGRLVEALVEPFDIDGREVSISASVGVAVSQHGDETPEELLRDAVAAMHRARELGGGRFEAFDVSLRLRLVERMAIEHDLRYAVERDQLELHYQPLIGLGNQSLVGFEALVRWHHPERGMVGPGEFIAVAEDTGLIVPIGNWVLRRVCAQLAAWPEQVELAANLSPRQIRPELVLEVEQLLSEYRISPGRLVLEITESLVLDPLTKPVIGQLRELGVQLALDDFGTGYSSLGSLQRFPLDVVKLDRALIWSLDEGSGVAVVRAAVELGQALGMHVIAEGIETEAQLATLRELGCQRGQGFLFSEPLRVHDAARFLDGSATIALPGR